MGLLMKYSLLDYDAHALVGAAGGIGHDGDSRFYLPNAWMVICPLLMDFCRDHHNLPVSGLTAIYRLRGVDLSFGLRDSSTADARQADNQISTVRDSASSRQSAALIPGARKFLV